MVDRGKFKPNTVYVTYIASTPEKVWQALTSAEFSRQYFFGFAVNVEPKVGGKFELLQPDGGKHIEGEVIEYDPPHKLSATWSIVGIEEMRKLPPCLVTYEIAMAGDAVRLTMSEAHSWDIPEAILAGGRSGWPAILSNLKSVLETGKPMAIKMEPPKEMMEAIRNLKI